MVVTAAEDAPYRLLGMRLCRHFGIRWTYVFPPVATVFIVVQLFLGRPYLETNDIQEAKRHVFTIQDEKRHVFFLKVHKAASTTVQNVLFRFALSRGLQVMLPKQGHILSQTDKNWLNRALPPPNGTTRFDILCNHIVFDERSVRGVMPEDTVFIGILREPFDQFLSAFKYYRDGYRLKYLQNIQGSDPLATYLSNISRWEPEDLGISFTNNRMSFDFGIDPRRMTDLPYVIEYVRYLNEIFHLVLISERFDESMVLMKRLLGWKMKDILYIKNNVYKQKTAEMKNTSEHMNAYTETQKLEHKRHNIAEYVLYEHFSKLFDKRVSEQGRQFADEVKTYQAVRENVGTFCFDRKKTELIVKATVWCDSFTVTREDCDYMMMSEETFVRTIKAKYLITT